LIPFADSRLRQRIALRVADAGQLFWSDAWMSGRVSRGESWRFDRIDHELRLIVRGSLRYLERYALSPAKQPMSHPWIAGTAHYFGTSVICSMVGDATLAEVAQQRVGTIPCVRAGIDRLEAGLTVGRVISADGPCFTAARTALRAPCGRPPLRRL
jgi:urease accessory protein UreH